MATNPLAGHTAAQNTDNGDNGLREGDSLSSPTLTNMLEGIHGNGIIRLQDGAYDSSRNETNSGNQPGSMTKHSDIWKLNVQGGLAVLDGVLYEFGGGPGGAGSVVELGTHGTGSALGAAGEQSVYVIYVTPKGTDGHLHVSAAGGPPVQTSTGIYPQLPDTHLITNATTNEKIIVIGTVRCSYTTTGGGSNSHNVQIDELNDQRHFISSAARYMVPLTASGLDDGSGGAGTKHIVRGATKGITTAAELLNMNGEMTSPVDGNFGAGHAGGGGLIDVTAMWVSHANNEAASLTAGPSASDAGYGHGPSRGRDRAGNATRDILFYAGQDNAGAGMPAIRLSGRGVDATSAALTTASADWDVTPSGDSIFILQANAAITLTPTGQFPEGHIIEVRNTGSSTIAFAGLATIGTNVYARYVWEGSAWIELFRV